MEVGAGAAIGAAIAVGLGALGAGIGVGYCPSAGSAGQTYDDDVYRYRSC